MPAVIQLIPNVTIIGGDSSFALAGRVATPAATSVEIAPSFVVYGAAFASPSSTPTGAVIEAGSGAITTASGNAIAALNFTGLSPNTTYDFYLVGKTGIEYTSVTKITATTNASGGGLNPAIFIGARII